MCMAWLMQDLTMFVPIIGEDPNFVLSFLPLIQPLVRMD